MTKANIPGGMPVRFYSARARIRSLGLGAAAALSAGLGFLVPSSRAQAEAFGRVYQVTLTLIPTDIFQGAMGESYVVTFHVGPNDRRAEKNEVFPSSQAPYTINRIRSRVYLAPDKDGGSDNGTVECTVNAEITHAQGGHMHTLITHSTTLVPLEKGNGQARELPTKYFTGFVTVKVIAD